MARFIPILKLLAIVIVGLFVIKFLTKWFATKWPNQVTTALDNVVQTV